jgi:hypothetical protein
LFDEENFQPGVRQIERSPHPTDTAANNHGRSNCRAMRLPPAKDDHRAPHHCLTSARLYPRSLGLFSLYEYCQSQVNDEIFFTKQEQ